MIDINTKEIIKEFKNAVEAKTYIKSLVCLIGSRMHATIGGLSSGTPVIPVSYSRKFEGLFSSLSYNHVISLLELDTQECVARTMTELFSIHTLRKDVVKANRIATDRINEMKETIAIDLMKHYGQ